jgi:1-acyl-sn-glycerol-3-phosphate acyltransferase
LENWLRGRTSVLYYILRPIFWALFRTIVAVLGGLRVENPERVPRRGPVLIAPNHVSFADPAVLGICVKRYAWFLATDEMFEMPVLGSLARLMRAFPIRQDSPDRAALRRTTELLKRGEAVVVFPEGHVSKDGRMQPIQAGIILLAVHTGAPVVPVGIIGTDSMMPPHQWKLFHARRKMIVRFGQPISPEELTGGLKGRAGLDHGVEVLGRAIAQLCDQPEPASRKDEAARREEKAGDVAERRKLRV